MNKTALKRFATEARKELMERVQLQAMKIGITAKAIEQASVESSDAVFIGNKRLTDIERRQRNKLITRINEAGFDQVMDEAAYTWFNRFIALRFMEVNDYLPTKVRVLSSSDVNSVEPDMMKEALSLDLELDKEYVYNLKLGNETDELFKYLIKMHCNDLNRYMPFMFETIEDYTEILFPEGLLGTDSFVRKMTDTEVIPEGDWEKVEIIGWLYQYYISEEKEKVIQAKKRYKAEELPFATQLFTPEWIVRYMVQNALGRYWIESHPDHKDLLQNWEFYLESRENDYEEKLAPYINKELSVEDIKCIDPAMGSGHILVYMFDILFEIYNKCGYMEREIPRLIIEKNLYGLDIDNRAYQLASFSIIMKALQYNKRFLRSIGREGLLMNLTSIQETNQLTEEDIVFLAGKTTGEQFTKMNTFIRQFSDAKVIGSLLKLEFNNEEFLRNRLLEIEQQSDDLFTLEKKERLLNLYRNLIRQTKIMSLKYDIFITNPPYAGSRIATLEVSNYLAKHYPNAKADLFSSFIDYGLSITKDKGQLGFLTPYVWMFISSYEHIRKKIVGNKNISSLVQLEYNGFEAAMVPVCIFTLRNYKVDVPGEYIRLANFRGIENQSIKTAEAVQSSSVPYRYTFNQANFSKIPGSLIAYWVSQNMINNFNEVSVGSQLTTREGMATADNSRFLRFWFEVANNSITYNCKSSEESQQGQVKWVPYNKGGSYRKWYGNNDYIVNWENNGFEIRNNIDEKTGRIRSHNYNGDYGFKKGITWSALSSGSISVRYCDDGFLFDSKGAKGFCENETDLKYILGVLNSRVGMSYLEFISPTMDFKVGDVIQIPLIISVEKEKVVSLVEENILITKQEWDSFETSWDFKSHPILIHRDNASTLRDSANSWMSFMTQQFNHLKENEEKLNQLLLETYNLENEFTPEIDEKNVSIEKANLERDIKSLISYAIGCSFGRYSLDKDGLIYAGGKFDSSYYSSFPADEDNILPILSSAYFEDDLVTRFVDFVRILFGKETLEENLDFAANAIGRRKNETARETLRRYFLNDFYKDHVQAYKKHPIYWMFTSGKEKAFNCFIYMHRYDKTTLSRIRTDYLHEVQTRMDVEKQDLLGIIKGDSTAKEISSAKKQLKSIDKKIDELKAYDELLHHYADMQIQIDLDDGVKVNYEKFKGLVAKI